MVSSWNGGWGGAQQGLGNPAWEGPADRAVGRLEEREVGNPNGLAPRPLKSAGFRESKKWTLPIRNAPRTRVSGGTNDAVAERCCQAGSAGNSPVPGPVHSGPAHSGPVPVSWC